MSDAPSIEEELERKASETLAEALNQLSRGQCTPEAAKASLQAVWGCAAGLVSKDLMELIAESIDSVSEMKNVPRRRILSGIGRVGVVDLPETEGSDITFTVVHEHGQKPIVIDGSEMTKAEAAERVEQVINSLTKLGFKEILND